MTSLNSKILRAVLLLGMAMGLVTCRTDGGGDISISITPTQVYALPIAAQSCASQYGTGSGSGSGGSGGSGGTSSGTDDLASPTMSFNRIRLAWSSSSLLQIAYIQLTFVSPAIQGGSFTCYIANTELATVFYGSGAGGATPISTVTINPAVSQTIDNYSGAAGTGCPIRCGSIPLVNQNASAFISGTASVIGVAIDSSGNETPAQGQTSVSFQWQALPP